MRLAVWIFLSLVWGFSWVGIKLTLEGIPPFIGSGLRFALAVPLVFGWARLRAIPLHIERKDWKILLWSSFLTYGFSYGLVYWGEQRLNAGVAAILFATFPIFTALFAGWLLPEERIGWQVVVGLVIAFTGVVVTFSEDFAGLLGDVTVVSAAAVVVGAAGGALATVLVKKRLCHLHPVSLTLWQMVLGAAGLCGAGLLLGEGRAIIWNDRAILGLVYLGVVASALAFTLYYWLLRHSPAVTVSSMIFVTPIVALWGDFLIYGTPITLETLLGMGLVFLGIIFSEFVGRTRGKARETVPATFVEPAETSAGWTAPLPAAASEGETQSES
ncbi:MAG: DMT family transporter [Acidobacteriota bacterium]